MARESTRATSYWWTRDGKVAMLHSISSRSFAYDQPSVEAALATIKARRHEYVTEQAWRDQLEIFERGVAMFYIEKELKNNG